MAFPDDRPISGQPVLVNLKEELSRLSDYQPTGSEPHERFFLPRKQLTTIDSVVVYQETSRDEDLWERYLRIDHQGDIEYAEVYPVFYEWDGTRLFRYV